MECVYSKKFNAQAENEHTRCKDLVCVWSCSALGLCRPRAKAQSCRYSMTGAMQLICGARSIISPGKHHG